jgi:hypothetical protein
MPVIYALLCGELIYVAFLSLFGRRMTWQRWPMAIGSLGLGFSFALLGLVTAGVTKHGQYATLTRLGFVIYGLSLAVIIVQYFAIVWQSRWH